MTSGLHALLAATLFVSPGAWIAFTVCDRAATSSRVRWALAAVLSPACFAVEVVVLSACGVSFAAAVPILAYVNLAALALPFLGRAGGERERTEPEAWLTLATWLALIAPIAAAWLRAPDYRVYGWHNAMNTAIAYRVAELPTPPEDPDLAGVRLNYGWLGHAGLTGIASMADVPPTVVFPFVNALMLLAALVFMEAASTALGLRNRATATLTSGLVLAGTMFTGLVVHRMIPPDHPSAIVHELSGDLRVAPILTKFHNFDSMVIGIAGVAALVYFVIASASHRAPRAWALCGIVVAAVGLSYPLLFPFAGVLLAVVLATSFARAEAGARSSLVERRALFAVACAAACAAVLAYVRFLGKDSETSFLEPFHGVAVLYALITMVHVLGPWLAIAWPSFRAALRTRSAPEFQLALTLVVLIAIALVLQMKGDTHYKVYFAQVLVLAPLVGVRVDGWFEKRPARVALTGAAVVALSLLTATWIHAESPRRARAEAVRLDESSFAILPPRDPAYDWIRAIRERTDRDAVVVARPSDLPLAVLTGRSQYVSMAPPDDTLLGYSLEMRFLFENKGYPASVVAERERVVRTCYLGGEGDVAFEGATAALRSLGRPIVIVFAPRGSAYQRWLESQGIGAAIHRDETAWVWLVTR